MKMNMKRISRSLLLIGTLFLPAALALCVNSASAEYLQSLYREGDWVSITDQRTVYSLDLDHRVLYAGTSGGVLRYNYVQRTWETPLTTSDGLPGREVLVVAFDPDRGDLWCGTRTGLGVYNVDLKSWRVYGRAQGLGSDEILEIMIGSGDNSNYVYVRTPGTWNRFEKGSDLIERVAAGSVPRSGESKRQGPVDPAVFSSDTYPFLNTRTDPDEHLRTFAVTSVVEDGWGNLWVGTDGGSIYSVSLISYIWKNHRFGLVSRSVTAVEKNGDSIWFGGGELFNPGSGGLTRMSRSMDEWEYHEQEYTRELGRSEINDLETTGKYIWAATSTGLVCYDTDRDRWSRFQRRDGIPDDHVLCLDSNGGFLWAGTRSGAVRVDTDSTTFAHVAGVPLTAEVRAIRVAGGSVWMGTDTGLYVTREDSLLARSTSLPGSVLTADIRGLSFWGGSLFIATERGLYRYDMSEDRLVSDPYPGPVTGVRLLSVEADSANLWIGTDTGVERFRRDMGSWVSYQQGNFELLSSPVTDILIDGDFVWFATPEGATRFYWNEPFRSR